MSWANLLGTLATSIAGFVAGEYLYDAAKGNAGDPIAELNAKQNNEIAEMKSKEKRRLDVDTQNARVANRFQGAAVRDLAVLGSGDADEQLGLRRPNATRYDPALLEELAAKTDPLNIMGPHGFMVEAARRRGLIP